MLLCAVLSNSGGWDAAAPAKAQPWSLLAFAGEPLQELMLPYHCLGHISQAAILGILVNVPQTAHLWAPLQAQCKLIEREITV